MTSSSAKTRAPAESGVGARHDKAAPGSEAVPRRRSLRRLGVVEGSIESPVSTRANPHPSRIQKKDIGQPVNISKHVWGTACFALEISASPWDCVCASLMADAGLILTMLGHTWRKYGQI